MKALLFIFALMLSMGVTAQINIKDKLKSKTHDRAEERTDQGVDKGLDKVEEKFGGIFKKKVEKTQEEREVDYSDSTEAGKSDHDSPREGESPQHKSLESYTNYDFVPGDQLLYFDDFSQDETGDFPTYWSSNSSGEVKTINITDGHWFHMNGEDATYCYSKEFIFPENFIFEFDLIPDAHFDYGVFICLYEDPANQEFTAELFPGLRGIRILIDDDKWESAGYYNESEEQGLIGKSTTATVQKERVNHVIIWVQNRRLRIYHDGKKAVDMPTIIYSGTKFNRFLFSIWDTYSWPYISNIKITTAAPDTRSKLITEGKFVSYGIYFDSGKDQVKPESYGALSDLAKVLKENPDVRVRIVGHTDSDGSDELNLDLSGRRAANVRKTLTDDHGIAGDRMDTQGAGETQPLAPNDTAGNKAKNRRVEFIKI